MVKEIAERIRDKFPGKTLSGIGGIESGKDAAQFILLGADTVQVCTGVMKFGYDMVAGMKDELLSFMARHNFETIADFKGHSLQYFTTHADLVRRQAEAKAAAKEKVAAAKAASGAAVTKDGEWKGDSFVKQSDALARG
jgi:dihydropyrimidine dehydrogenase (NADP+)/dihydropyrimidine dehydrogenase (NAD+) subunit PreA